MKQIQAMALSVLAFSTIESIIVCSSPANSMSGTENKIGSLEEGKVRYRDGL